MYRSIATRIPYPSWTREGDRYQRLYAFDLMLDGDFYDHIDYDYYSEEDHQGNYVELRNRRPSATFGFAATAADTASRKLFAGSRAPRITHEKISCIDFINSVIEKSALFDKMMLAAFWGTCGSVGLTFKLLQGVPIVAVWRARNCQVSFDEMGELDLFRVNYTTSGATFLATGFTLDSRGEPIVSTSQYWLVKDWTKESETTYRPIPESDYVPTISSDEALQPEDDRLVLHGLGLVPAVWIMHRLGGIAPDGRPAFNKYVLNNCIDMDYTLSQLGSGVRYNAAPTTVIIGESEYDRGPTKVIKLKASTASDDQKDGAGDAKLLEMVGNGTRAGLEYLERLERVTKRMVAASHKDPEGMKGTISGRALEIADDGFHDMILAMRKSYGDSGLVPLLSKILTAFARTGSLPDGISEKEATAFGLRWPKLYASTPADELSMVQAIVMGITQPPDPAASPARTNGGAATKEGEPQGAPATKPGPKLIDLETARSYLWAQFDLEDFRTETPPGPEPDAPPPIPEVKEGEGDNKYNEGINPDGRKPGTQGTVLPRRRVGGPQTSI